MNVYIKITSRCNLACKHCFSDNTNLDIDPIHIQNFIQNNRNYLENATVILHGGEPLLYDREKLKKIISIIRDENLELHITSNLFVHLDDDLIELLSRFDYIKTSFDFNRFTSISQIVRWIHNIKKIHSIVPMGLNITATNMMIHKNIHKIFNIACKLNLSELDISPIFTEKLVDQQMIPSYQEFLNWLLKYYEISKLYPIQNALAYKLEHPMEFYTNYCCNNNITLNEDGSISICPTNTEKTRLAKDSGNYIIKDIYPQDIFEKCMQCSSFEQCGASCHAFRNGSEDICKAYFTAVSLIRRS